MITLSGCEQTIDGSSDINYINEVAAYHGSLTPVAGLAVTDDAGRNCVVTEKFFIVIDGVWCFVGSHPNRPRQIFDRSCLVQHSYTFQAVTCLPTT